MKYLRFSMILVMGFLFACEEIDLGHDLYVIRQGRLYGYINSNGVMEISPQFAYALPFSEGIAGVNVGGTTNGKDMPTNGKWGFIDTLGHYIINPIYHSPVNGAPPFARKDVGTVLHEAYMFREGVAPVRTDNGWRYIDIEGTPLYQNFEMEACRAFREGMAAVMINGYWGYLEKGTIQLTDPISNDTIERYGLRIAIEPNYLYPVDFQDGFALVKDRKGRKICIDKKGQQHFSQYRMESQFHNGMAIVRAKFKGESITQFDNQKYAIMDTAGRMWFAPQFDEVGFFASGLCPARVGSSSRGEGHSRFGDYDGGKWGYVNRDGEFVINPVFDHALNFEESRAPVKRGPYWGYIDERGRMVGDAEFLWAGHFRHGVATVLLGPNHNDFYNHYAYINRNGNVLWVEP